MKDLKNHIKDLGYDDINITTDLLLNGDDNKDEKCNIKIIKYAQDYIYKTQRLKKVP